MFVCFLILAPITLLEQCLFGKNYETNRTPLLLILIRFHDLTIMIHYSDNA